MGNKSVDTSERSLSEIILNHFNKLYFSVLFNLTNENNTCKKILRTNFGVFKRSDFDTQHNWIEIKINWS